MQNAKCKIQNAKWKTKNANAAQKAVVLSASRRFAFDTIAPRIRPICSPSFRSESSSSPDAIFSSIQILSQYTVSRASLSAISTYLMKSRLDEPAFASSRFAPIDVPDRKNWSTTEPMR